MIFPNLLGSIIYRVVTYALILAMTSTSTLPIIQQLPRATAVYLGMLQQLGLLQPAPSYPAGVRIVVPDGMEELEGVLPTINLDGEPLGLLFSDDAFRLEGENLEPDVPANPISVSRVQSSYVRTATVSDTLIITFTVTNNQPPAIVPHLFITATITDTLQAISTLDLASDPNVIHNVLLSDGLLSDSATLISADPMPDKFGGGTRDYLAWNLGDIPPMGVVTATLQVQVVPESVSTFLELDSGATAWGTLKRRMVSASTAPASLAPDGFGNWLQWTVDADYYDEYMIAKAAELGNDWQQMFAYVRSLRYESYVGSLRGTRGTLWSGAGNSMDQASLLIAMLRGSGIPARYRHGTLITGTAQSLILSMFPQPRGVVGHIPFGTQVADPANDPRLLRETIDHWWVQAYLPDRGWTDLDPSFAEAQPGETFYDSLVAGTDLIAELPDSQRHKVTISIKVEDYHPLNIASNGLQSSYPLRHTFNVVELVGRPVSLGHVVNSEQQSGMIFFWVRHTYHPYLRIEGREELVNGDTYQDLISNFPFGTFMTTGVWLDLEVTDPEGRVETYEREIADKPGFEARQAGGTVTVSQTGEPTPVVNDLDSMTMVFSPGLESAASVWRRNMRLLTQAEGLKQAYELSQELQAGNTLETAQGRRALMDVKNTARNALLEQERFRASYYSARSDVAAAYWSMTSLVRAYHDSPRIVIASSTLNYAEKSIEQILDLRRNNIRALTYPGQALKAGRVFNAIHGVTDALLEADVMEDTANGGRVIAAGTILQEARRQGIPLLTVTASNLQNLAKAEISGGAKARITQAVRNGKAILVPERMVAHDGTTTIAWWQLDPDTGEILGASENGTHDVFVQNSILRFFTVVLTAAEAKFLSDLLLLMLGLIVIAMLYAVLQTVAPPKPITVPPITMPDINPDPSGNGKGPIDDIGDVLEIMADAIKNLN